VSSAPSPLDPALARAYVACGYFLGRRGDELTAGLVGDSASLPLAAELGHADKSERARALAAALAEVVRALQAQRLL